MQLQSDRHWLLDEHAVVAVCMHVPVDQHRHVPPSHRLGAIGHSDGPPSQAGNVGPVGTSLQGVLTAPSGAFALDPEQSHVWPEVMHVKPSPQSELAVQVT